LWKKEKSPEKKGLKGRGGSHTAKKMEACIKSWETIKGMAKMGCESAKRNTAANVEKKGENTKKGQGGGARAHETKTPFAQKRLRVGGSKGLASERRKRVRGATTFGEGKEDGGVEQRSGNPELRRAGGGGGGRGEIKERVLASERSA